MAKWMSNEAVASDMVVATAVAAPWGPVHIAATARGVVAVEAMTTRDAFEAGLERRLGREVRWLGPAGPSNGRRGGARRGAEAAGSAIAVGHLRAAAAALSAATGGEEDAAAQLLHDLPIDLEDRPAWDRDVLDAVRAIPRGEVRGYGEVARAIGRPGAARAVGAAVGRNPVGLLIPCHRVVAGDGTLGGYGGGWWGDRERLLELKAELLAREGVVLPRSRPRGSHGR